MSEPLRGVGSQASLTIDVRLGVPSFDLDVRFTAKQGIVVLFGPTASGKTLSLRLVAGLERASSGTIRFGERTFDDGGRTFVQPENRGVGYAPQHGALWPHCTAREHLTALTTLAHADELLALVGLGAQATRKPPHLSGGERQRLSLARALARSAKLLLLDEPFSALHDDSRAAMGDIVRERAKCGATVLLVTHDRAEAARLGDTFVVFSGGVGTSAAAI
jgi:ABC-type sulfate/molybdate transport systems ATPase subunit